MTNNIAPLALAVDDDRDFLEIIDAKLTSQGYRVITAMSGDEAITKARGEKPVVILMDVEMPEKNGLLTATELANDAATKNIPLIFVTNLSEQTAEALASKISFRIDEEHYFRKDDDYGSLLKKIKKLMPNPALSTQS